MPDFQDWPNFSDAITYLRNHAGQVSVEISNFGHVIRWQDQFFVFYISRDHLVSDKGTYSTVFEIFKLDPATDGLYKNPETGQPLTDPHTGQLYDDTRYIIRLVSRANSLPELKIMNQLYRNIYPVSDVFVLDCNNYAVVAPYLGQCLHDIKDDQFSLIDRVDLLFQIAMQLNSMLKQRTFDKTCMLHRDLKASNVVYQQLTINDKRTELLPSIIDFGLSEPLDYPRQILYKRDIRHPNMDYFTPETQPDVFGKAYYSGATDVGMFLEIYQRFLAGNIFGKKQQGRFPIHRIEVDPQWHCHDFNLTQCLQDFAELLHNEWPHKRPDADVLLRFFQQVSRYCHVMQLLTDMPAAEGSVPCQNIFGKLLTSIKRCYDYLDTLSQLKKQLQSSKAQLILLSMGAWSTPIIYRGQTQSFEDFPFDAEQRFCEMVLTRQNELTPARVGAIFALQYHKNLIDINFINRFVFDIASEASLLALNRLTIASQLDETRFGFIYNQCLQDESCQAIESLAVSGLLTDDCVKAIIDDKSCSWNQLHAFNQLVDKGWIDQYLLSNIMPDILGGSDAFQERVIKLLPYLACSRAMYDPENFKKFVRGLSYNSDEILIKFYEAITQHYGRHYDDDCLRQTMFNFVLMSITRLGQPVSVQALLAMFNMPADLKMQRGVKNLIASDLEPDVAILNTLLTKADANFWYHINDWHQHGLLKPHLMDYPVLEKLAHSIEKQQAVNCLLNAKINFHLCHTHLCSADTLVAQFYRHIVQAHRNQYSQHLDSWLIDQLSHNNSTLNKTSKILGQPVKYKTNFIQKYQKNSINECWQALRIMQQLTDQQCQLVETAYPYSFKMLRANLLKHVIHKVVTSYDELIFDIHSKQPNHTKFIPPHINYLENKLAALHWLLQLLKQNTQQAPVEIDTVSTSNDYYLVDFFRPIQANVDSYKPYTQQQFTKSELSSVLQTDRQISQFVQPLLKDIKILSSRSDRVSQQLLNDISSATESLLADGEVSQCISSISLNSKAG